MLTIIPCSHTVTVDHGSNPDWTEGCCPGVGGPASHVRDAPPDRHIPTGSLTHDGPQVEDGTEGWSTVTGLPNAAVGPRD